MSDNPDDAVISFATRRKISEEQAEKIEIEKRLEKVKTERASENQKDLLAALDAIRELVVKGQVDSMAVVARNPENGHFLSELITSKAADPGIFSAFAGKLDMIKLEAMDMAMMGPHMLRDGTYMILDQELESPDDFDE